MNHKHETWGWLLAFDFFFGGMGAAMLLLAGIAELFLKNENISTIGIIAACVFIAAGTGLLLLELGRPLQSWRVFMNLKSIMTIGAYNMSIAIVAGLLLASSWIDIFPWFGMIGLRKVLAVICIITGLVVAAYPGILLGRHKSRPFWNGPGMLILFLTSSLLTGLSAYIICGWFTETSSAIYEIFPYMAAALCALQLISWLGYLWVKSTGTTKREADAAKRWTSGNFSKPFKIGFILAGTILPLILYMVPNRTLIGVAAVLTIVGGLIMRNLVVYAGQERTWLPGEEKYRSRLPYGDEAFMQKVWTKSI